MIRVAGVAGKVRRCVLWSTTAVVIGLLATLPAAAMPQEVDLPAGRFSGELQCPEQGIVAPPASVGHRDDALEPPGSEALAGLPVRGEGRAQPLDLGERPRADSSRPLAIGLWGDSHAASGYFSEELVRALGLTQEKVQPTFIPPTMARSGVRLPIHKHCQSGGWSYEYAYTASAFDGNFARGLVNLKTVERNSYLWVDFRRQPPAPNLRALELLYVPPRHGDTTLLGISADGGAERFVELRPDGDGILHLRTGRPVSVIKLRLIVGSLVLQGLVPHYVGKPELYLDTLGIPGATVRGWKRLNTDYIKRRDGAPAYDLVILEYGTNEGNDANLDLQKYAADLRASLHNLRQLYPDSLCVLIGPTDRGVLVRRSSRAAVPSRNLLGYALIHQRIGAIQSAIGREYACAFWNWQDAMGGPGAAYVWMRQMPVLMAKDLIHLTAAGYQASARKFIADTSLTRYVLNR